jgi:hypothetical protein
MQLFIFIFQLEITVLNTDISPKSVLYLNVTGPPLSKVGFLAVDKAVYQISDKNRMQKKKVNLFLRSYYFLGMKIVDKK